MADKQAEEKKGKFGEIRHIVGNVIGIILIIALLPIMIMNMTLIIKSYARPQEVPSVFGVTPLIVLTGSMYPTIQVNDLIFVKKTDAKNLQVDDIIAFQPQGDIVVVTHRIIGIEEGRGTRAYITKGDANNTKDMEPCEHFQVVGIYFGKIAGIGAVAEFLQQPLGMVICVAVPLALFLIYDVVRRMLYNRRKKGEVDEEKQELERLRALAAALEKGEPLPEQLADKPADEAPAEAAPAEETPAQAEPEAPAEPEPTLYPPVEGEDFDDEV